MPFKADFKVNASAKTAKGRATMRRLGKAVGQPKDEDKDDKRKGKMKDNEYC